VQRRGGLPDFRGKDGFWGAYPALGKRGISFEQMALPQWFSDDPAMAWAFYGHRQQLYRTTKPHMGYWMLRDWGRSMPAGYFVVTSNVDGHFEAAEFPPDLILEQHGCIHRYQCTLPCSDALWLDDPPDLDIDLEALQARGTLPRCPECGVLARPNVMMFGDVRWVARATKVQQQRYAKWLASVRSRVTLVRINSDASDADEPAVPIRMGALEALSRIEERLPEGFGERCKAPVGGLEAAGGGV
jgi:NAD-dependent SIR2 family protein deacetylase